MFPSRVVIGLLRRGLYRPRVLGLLIRGAWRFRARAWNRRPPFLPIPPAEYLAWRLHTAYGDAGALPGVADVERYLEWVERMNSRNSLTGGRATGARDENIQRPAHDG